MSAFFAKIISFFMTILAFFGLVKPQEKPEAVVYDNAVITVEDNKLTIDLEANPTTGYEWTYTVVKGDPASVTDKYVADKVPAGVVGSGGTEIFTVIAEEDGEYSIRFDYLRSFEDDSVIKTVTVSFTVENGVVTESITTA